MKKIAELALDRPSNLVECVREMFAMQASGECRDRWTNYFPPRVADIIKSNVQGVFGGIGIQIEWINGAVTVVAPLPDTPAAHAGIRSGDIILKIDGREPKDIESAINSMRGEVNTKVTITIIRKGLKNPLEITLVRAAITAESVKFEIVNGHPSIGLVKIRTFQKATAHDFEKAFAELKKKGAKSFVIDLRNNPGGLLNTVETMLGLFMGACDTVVTLRYRDAEEVINKDVAPLVSMPEKIGKFRDERVVILINEGSASASEIFAGTMKDWGYPVVGETSFKKGVGQTISTLSDGSLFVLTTFEFLVGNNRVVIRDKGVEPTFVVPQEDDVKPDLQLRKALRVLRKPQYRGEGSLENIHCP